MMSDRMSTAIPERSHGVELGQECGKTIVAQSVGEALRRIVDEGDILVAVVRQAYT
jgi:hypothetical protein